MHAIYYLQHYISVPIFNLLYTICIVSLAQYKYPCLRHLYSAEQGSRPDIAVLDIAVENLVIELQNNKATKLVSAVIIFTKLVYFHDLFNHSTFSLVSITFFSLICTVYKHHQNTVFSRPLKSFLIIKN